MEVVLKRSEISYSRNAYKRIDNFVPYALRSEYNRMSFDWTFIGLVEREKLTVQLNLLLISGFCGGLPHFQPCTSRTYSCANKPLCFNLFGIDVIAGVSITYIAYRFKS